MSARPSPARPPRIAARVPRTAPSRTPTAVAACSDGAATFSCELSSALGPGGPILVLHVAGEIDLLTLPTLHHVLTGAAEQRPSDLVVDLTAVSFCCVRGFALLATTAATMQAHGIAYAVSGLLPSFDHFATMLWPEQGVIRYRSLAAAVTAIRIDHTDRPT